MIRTDHHALDRAPNSFQTDYYYDYPIKEDEQEREKGKACYNNDFVYLVPEDDKKAHLAHLTHNNDQHSPCCHYEEHSCTASSMEEEEEENDNKQKYLGEIWEEKNLDTNETPTFTQEPKKRKLSSYLASTLNFPYKEGLTSWNNDNFKSATSSKNNNSIWKDQGDQAEMLEKHFNSAWQCKFVMDFYGIGGTCHYEENQAKKCNSKDLDNTYLATGEKENTAVVLCREEEQQKKDNMNDDMLYFKDEDFLKARDKLMDAMDLTDESRAKVFRIEESMNINRTEYLRGFRMSSK